MAVNSGAGPDGSRPARLRTFITLPPPPKSACRPDVAEASELLLHSQSTARSRTPCSIVLDFLYPQLRDIQPHVQLTCVVLKRSSQAECLAALGHQACGQYLGDVSAAAAI